MDFNDAVLIVGVSDVDVINVGVDVGASDVNVDLFISVVVLLDVDSGVEEVVEVSNAVVEF